MLRMPAELLPSYAAPDATVRAEGEDGHLASPGLDRAVSRNRGRGTEGQTVGDCPSYIAEFFLAALDIHERLRLGLMKGENIQVRDIDDVHV